ncbi:polyketide synthase dehydratase domain-containing protein, partial [Streptomyces chumphonensis]|uniref:polyketide synthase dehydratase domain-containing protein n=1 Tax=Streptomyces chumphonensis TaxID=1214925 RepID=UPI003D76460D
MSGFYAEAAAAGYGYGPAFQGLRAAWRRGDEIFAEVALPEEARAEAGRYGLHPALLDSALHAVGLGDPTGETADGLLRLPFAWNDVSLTASGATAVRVRLAPAGPDAVSIELADATGQPVAWVGSLGLRAVRPERVAVMAEAASARGHGDSLFTVRWSQAPRAGGTDGPPTTWAVVGEDPLGLGAAVQGAGIPVDAYPDGASLRAAVEAGVPAPRTVLCTPPAAPAGDHLARTAEETTAGMLGVVQEWLADDGVVDARLAVVTRGAVATGGGDDVVDLAAAATWGLVRTAQTEAPGRFLLVDLDPAAADDSAAAEDVMEALSVARSADE